MRKTLTVLGAIALVLLISTGAFAAKGLITGADIKNGSVTGVDIRNRSLGAVELSSAARVALRGARGPVGAPGPTGAQGVAGAQGLKGDTGATGATGATGSQGGGGATGATGATGPAGADGATGFSALEEVPSGATIRGVIGADYHNTTPSGTSDWGVDMTLPMPAPVGLTDADVFVNVDGWQDGGGQTEPTTTDTDPGCDGTVELPTAPAGSVCIYVTGADNAVDLKGYSVAFGTGSSKYGFKLKWSIPNTPPDANGNDTFVDAVWAYTAP